MMPGKEVAPSSPLRSDTAEVPYIRVEMWILLMFCKCSLVVYPSWPKEAAEFFLLDQHVSEVPVSELTIKEVNAAEQYMHAICMHMLFFS